MSAAFNKCVKSGGKIRTKKISKNRYMRICFIGGKEIPGEIKTKKK